MRDELTSVLVRSVVSFAETSEHKRRSALIIDLTGALHSESGKMLYHLLWQDGTQSTTDLDHVGWRHHAPIAEGGVDRRALQMLVDMVNQGPTPELQESAQHWLEWGLVGPCEAALLLQRVLNGVPPVTLQHDIAALRERVRVFSGDQYRCTSRRF